MSKIRLLLADDHTILRDSMRAFFSLFPDLEIVGEAGDGLETIAQAMQLAPDVVILDIAMPNLSGQEVIHRLKRDLPACKIVILSQYQDPDYVLPALRAGADGYVLKKSGGNEVVQAVRAVLRGEAYLHPAVAQLVLETSVRGASTWQDPLDTLTEREREVLALLGQGNTNQEIAEKLVISRKTVDKHRANLLQKLQLRSRAELIRYALERGLSLDRAGH